MLLPSVSASVVINEIMPQGFEWIEIYNPESLNLDLSNWAIRDDSTNSPDTITCYSIENCSLITNKTFFLILGRNTNISQITNEPVDYFYVDDQKIGNGLNDDGDLILFDDIYNNVTTNSSYYSSSQGKSWARIQENLEECATPTPGKENSCESENNEADETEQQGQQEQQAEEQERDEETSTTYGETSYSFFDVPSSIRSEEDFSFTVRIGNNKNLEQKFEAWSYVYRGSKCYSCYWNKTRESNKQEITVQPHSYKEIKLYDQANASSGNYKMKVKILKRGFKTPKEFTFNITILADGAAKEISKNSSQSAQESSNETKNLLNVEPSDIKSITGNVVYESKSEGVKEKGVWLLALLLMAIIVYLILKKQ